MILRQVTLADGCELIMFNMMASGVDLFFIELNDMRGKAVFEATSEAQANRIFKAFVNLDLQQ